MPRISHVFVVMLVKHTSQTAHHRKNSTDNNCGRLYHLGLGRHTLWHLHNDKVTYWQKSVPLLTLRMKGNPPDKRYVTNIRFNQGTIWKYCLVMTSPINPVSASFGASSDRQPWTHWIGFQNDHIRWSHLENGMSSRGKTDNAGQLHHITLYSIISGSHFH